MRTLSKSKLMAFRQCPRRLWLEIHRPTLREDSAASQASFDTGHKVGEIARQIYDPTGDGVLIDPQSEGFEAALVRSQVLLKGRQVVFEAGLKAEGALAFADVMLPVKLGTRKAWRMVEVKSSTSVKDYHREDAAVQTFIARSAGIQLAGIALAHIDSSWTYPGNNDYAGLLVEEDLTEEAFSRSEEVRSWIAEAQRVANQRKEPVRQTGRHCSEPFECGFYGHCHSQEPQASQPVVWLPRIQSKGLKAFVEQNPACEMRDVPDHLLNAVQMRVKSATLNGKAYFDREGAKSALAPYKLPAYFMDFESIQFGVPIWKGTRPYQQICFQFSVHRLSRTGTLGHAEFLDVSGMDPSEAFARELIEACGERGPVFVYNAAFETTRIKELASRFPRLAKDLHAITDRVVDLLPIAQANYYHPSQQGSWSIKAVLPAACPDLCYDDLDGVKDGGMAMAAFAQAIAPDTDAAAKEDIRRQLLAYCKLDTLAMVRLWEVFSGRQLIR